MILNKNVIGALSIVLAVSCGKGSDSGSDSEDQTNEDESSEVSSLVSDNGYKIDLALDDSDFVKPDNLQDTTLTFLKQDLASNIDLNLFVISLSSSTELLRLDAPVGEEVMNEEFQACMADVEERFGYVPTIYDDAVYYTSKKGSLPCASPSDGGLFGDEINEVIFLGCKDYDVSSFENTPPARSDRLTGSCDAHEELMQKTTLFIGQDESITNDRSTKELKTDADGGTCLTKISSDGYKEYLEDCKKIISTEDKYVSVVEGEEIIDKTNTWREITYKKGLKEPQSANGEKLWLENGKVTMTYNTWIIDITFGAKGTNPTYKAQKGDITEEGELTFSGAAE